MRILCLILLLEGIVKAQELSNASFYLRAEKKPQPTGTRVYVNQFPEGSEHIPLKPIALFSVYMGHISYDYLPYTVASMKFNPQVDFVIVNVGDDLTGGDSTNPIRREAARHGVGNVILFEVTIAEWRERVFKYLGIDVPFTKEWYYKMCDYKPTLAVLFPEVFARREYAYWGYGDMDVVWGNFSRFSHLFQGQFPVVISGWWHSTGALALFNNSEPFRNLFRRSPMYIPLLKNLTYHNLDEHGIQVDQKSVVDGGRHSMSHIIGEMKGKEHWNWNTGKTWQDHCFLDAGDSDDWAGPVIWHNGALTVARGSAVFPPGRELLFYHRPHKLLNYRTDLRESLLEDGIKFGFVLPSWIPLMSRHTCRLPHNKLGQRSHLHAYQPYHSQECYGGADNEATDPENMAINKYPH